MARWKCTVDNKWRLTIPVSIREEFKDWVLFRINKECVKMTPNTRNVSKLSVTHVIGKIKNRRVMIPPQLRDSVSFYFGKKVMIVKKGNHYEIWPWR